MPVPETSAELDWLESQNEPVMCQPCASKSALLNRVGNVAQGETWVPCSWRCFSIFLRHCSHDTYVALVNGQEWMRTQKWAE